MPTGETVADHFITFFANIFKVGGTVLSVGMLSQPIPSLCTGTMAALFVELLLNSGLLKITNRVVNKKYWSYGHYRMQRHFWLTCWYPKQPWMLHKWIASKLLLAELPMPEVKVGMKETLMGCGWHLHPSGPAGESAGAVYIANGCYALFMVQAHRVFANCRTPDHHQAVVQKTANIFPRFWIRVQGPCWIPKLF